MNTPSGRKRILLIDSQDLWRAPAAQALEAAGFCVSQANEFDLNSESGAAERAPDVVILGCASVGCQERNWIQAVVAKGWPLQVLSASLPWEVMRSVFVAGASDVTERPYDPAQVVAIVSQTLMVLADRDEYSLVHRRRNW